MLRLARRAAAFVAVAALAGLAPTGASADPAWCESEVVIFSYIGGQTAVNSNVLVCLAAEVVLGTPDTAPYDGRLINPGSTLISVRFIGNLGGVPTAAAIINGLGYNNHEITLTGHEVVAGQPALGYVYDSEDLPIDPTASGCITADVPAAEDPIFGSTAFHTIDASCL